MRVDELRPVHFNFNSERESVEVLLSDELLNLYLDVRNAVAAVEVVNVELNPELLPDTARTLLGYLAIDLGKISVSLGLIGLAFFELCRKVVVSGYEVLSKPAVVNGTAVNKSAFNQSDYEIQPVEIDSE
jgi:hypothetical protein